MCQCPLLDRAGTVPYVPSSISWAFLPRVTADDWLKLLPLSKGMHVRLFECTLPSPIVIRNRLHPPPPNPLVVLIPVALLFGQDDISGWNIGEESDGRLLSACLAVFIQRMVVIIHLVGNDPVICFSIYGTQGSGGCVTASWIGTILHDCDGQCLKLPLCLLLCLRQSVA